MFAIDNYDFNGKKAIVRVDFNVPVDASGQITDDTRIRAALPTIRAIVQKGGSVVLMSHLGRPKGKRDEKYTLRPVAAHLSQLLGMPVAFADDCIGAEALRKKTELESGAVLLLENLRFYAEEEKGDLAFARDLASGVDVYVNDAFGTAHRAHASTSIIAQFFPNDKMFGYLMENEVQAMDKVLRANDKPALAIIGGAKVSSKIEVIENLLGRVDCLIIGGGMAYTFFKAQGKSVGASLVEESHLDTARNVLAKAAEKGVKVYLPVDSVNASEFKNDAERVESSSVDAIPDGMMGLDIGPASVALFDGVIASARIILWNGPMGVFEMERFSQGTLAVAKSIAKVTERGAYSLVGGGDSVAAVNEYNLADKISYVSTGGGAMLEYMEGKQLPGVVAIKG